MHDQRMPAGKQVSGHGLAHDAKTDERAGGHADLVTRASIRCASPVAFGFAARVAETQVCRTIARIVPPADERTLLPIPLGRSARRLHLKPSTPHSRSATSMFFSCRRCAPHTHERVV